MSIIWDNNKKARIRQRISDLQKYIHTMPQSYNSLLVKWLRDNQYEYTIDYLDGDTIDSILQGDKRDAFLVFWRSNPKKITIYLRISLQNDRALLTKAINHELGHLFLNHPPYCVIEETPYAVTAGQLAQAVNAVPQTQEREAEAESFAIALFLFEHHHLLDLDGDFSFRSGINNYFSTHLDFESFCKQYKLTTDIAANLLLNTTVNKFHFLIAEYDDNNPDLKRRICTNVVRCIPREYPVVIKNLLTMGGLQTNETALKRCLGSFYLVTIKNSLTIENYTLQCQASPYEKEKCIYVLGNLSLT